jgi:hypothetical protein
MAPRKTAAQKAAEAAEREEYTSYDTEPGTDGEVTPAGKPSDKDKQLSKVKDDKTGKFLTIQQLKNKLRNEAEREVLDKHKSEVVEITAAKYKEHNLEYVRRLTEEEKAAKQIEELYAQFPHLRPQLEQQQAQLDHNDANLPAQMEAERMERVNAVPGGALATFRAGDYEYTEDPEVEAREGE